MHKIGTNFVKRKEAILKKCPRGVGVFCDGTPNPVPKDKHKVMDKCKFWKGSRCTYIKETDGDLLRG